MANAFGLKGVQVLVTGSTAGIGLAIAKAFGKEGSHVVVNGRSNETVNAAIELLKKEVPEAVFLPAVGDVSSKEGTDKLVAALKAFDKPVEVLVNNVGIYAVKNFFELTDEEWQNIYDVNVISAVRTSRFFLKEMLERNSGRIVNIASDAGICPIPYMLHYSTTKSALIGFTRGLAELTKGTQVRINSVLSGPTWTPGVEKYIQGLAQEQNKSVEQAIKDYFRDTQPTSLLQRFLKPEEVADVVLFLASDRSNAVNGCAQRAEGGLIHHI